MGKSTEINSLCFLRYPLGIHSNWYSLSSFIQDDEPDVNIINESVEDKISESVDPWSKFDISYSDEFAKLDNDEAIRNAISTEGFKEESIDAVINGMIWINIDNYDGVDLAKETLKFIESGVEGGPGSL